MNYVTAWCSKSRGQAASCSSAQKKSDSAVNLSLLKQIQTDRNGGDRSQQQHDDNPLVYRRRVNGGTRDVPGFV